MFQLLLHHPTHTLKYPLHLHCLLTQRTGRVRATQVFDRPTEEPGNNAFAVQLKKLHTGISELQGKILKDEADDRRGSRGPEDFIYYAHTFYTELLEEQTLGTSRAGWLEALGDLARYGMAVAAMVTGSQAPGPEELTAAAISAVLCASPSPSVPPSSAADHVSNVSAKSSSASEKPVARIDDSPSPSIGLAPEKERWRGIVRDWYAQGLADTPGNGKLHHHLGSLSREKEGEELGAIYHFLDDAAFIVDFARILSGLRQPSIAVSQTHLSLDDFTGTLARFLERLEMEGEGVEGREWIMMGIVNIGALNTAGLHPSEE
ncbi:hypothetical protein PILCRDRAFT_8329 [Piloderma croceum F 1598]|uniref:Uncharacterized protein n=1 Tax=Piloderma croceum (strain F 1598) TaxID=765440 RepID=A0A0C3FTG3_PILCF|nr:hypothetical protein PILCRDRAFT_8329 [Piloderma croceum F 1598]